MSSTKKEGEQRFQGIFLLGLSLGTFGIGLFIASRQNRKARLSSPSIVLVTTELDPVVRPVPRRFNPHIHAFKALGAATGIVGVTAVCTVSVAKWYLDVRNVHPT